MPQVFRQNIYNAPLGDVRIAAAKESCFSEWVVAARRFAEIIADLIHQRTRVPKVQHLLTRASALKMFSIQLFCTGQRMPLRQSVKVVEEFKGRLLIFVGILMAVITLRYADAVEPCPKRS